MEPLTMAFAAALWQRSRSIGETTLSSGECPIRRSVALTLESVKTLKNGDSESLTVNACFKVSSKIGSPVVLTKSEIKIQSVSANEAFDCRRSSQSATATASTKAAAATQAIKLFREGLAARLAAGSG